MLLQLELGSTATPYEPYKESICYISAKDENGDVIELRRLPNGVYDEVSDGKLYKRNDGYILESSNIKSMYTLHTNLDWARIDKKVDAKDYGNIFLTGTTNLGGYSEFTTVPVDDANAIGKFSIRANSNEIWVGFEKGTSLATAQNALAGTSVTYQLAEEKVIDLQPQTLMAFPNGTIVIEPCYNQAFVYNSSDGGLKFDYAISNIEKIRKNGVDIDFTANIAPDGKSATVAELSDGDVVHVIAPIRPEESAVPEVIHSVPVNQAGVIANNTAAISAHNKAIQLINEDLAILIVLNT